MRCRKKQNAVHNIADAMKARRARKELQTWAIEQANKTADKLAEIGTTAKELINSGKNITKTHKKKRGRKSKSKYIIFIHWYDYIKICDLITYIN